MKKLLNLLALSALIIAPSCMKCCKKSCAPSDTKKTEKVEKKKKDTKKTDYAVVTVKE